MSEDSAESSVTTDQCQQCGESDWVNKELSEDLGSAIQCGNCGYRPRRERRQEIQEVLADE